MTAQIAETLRYNEVDVAMCTESCRRAIGRVAGKRRQTWRSRGIDDRFGGAEKPFSTNSVVEPHSSIELLFQKRGFELPILITAKSLST